MSKHTSHDDNKGETVSPEAAAGTQADAAGEEVSPDQPEGAPGKAEIPDPGEKIAALEAQITEAQDQYLRKAAEFENFRKRMNREKQDAIDFANQTLLLDLIPIIDDFERAIKSADTSKDFASFHEGISMIEKRLSSQLENKWGLKRFDSAGEIFDPNRHEAIMMDKSPEISEPVVQEDFLKGYTLKDRVVRAAKVKVLMPDNPGTGEGAAPAEPEAGEDAGLNP
jgi:molecular chaperone GrpE